jgi:hypothetical protein
MVVSIDLHGFDHGIIRLRFAAADGPPPLAAHGYSAKRTAYLVAWRISSTLFGAEHFATDSKVDNAVMLPAVFVASR